MAILYGLTFLQVGEGNGMKRVQNISGAGLMLLVWTTMTTLYAIAQVRCVKSGVWGIAHFWGRVSTAHFMYIKSTMYHGIRLDPY